MVSAFAQAKAPTIEGVWKITSVVTTGANAASHTRPQPSLIVFTKGYYSYISVNGDAPRRGRSSVRPLTSRVPPPSSAQR